MTAMGRLRNDRECSVCLDGYAPKGSDTRDCVDPVRVSDFDPLPRSGAFQQYRESPDELDCAADARGNAATAIVLDTGTSGSSIQPAGSTCSMKTLRQSISKSRPTTGGR